jgi:uncharacterized protein YjeT (DUF2065 family)
MDSALLAFGVTIIIFGIIISYFLVTSVLKIGRSVVDIQTQTADLIQTQNNEILSTTLIGGAIILIGVLIIKEALKR